MGSCAKHFLMMKLHEPEDQSVHILMSALSMISTISFSGSHTVVRVIERFEVS